MMSLDKEEEALLRKPARERHGGRKSSLGSLASTRMEKGKERAEFLSADDFLGFLKKGVKGKYSKYTKRSELYD